MRTGSATDGERDAAPRRLRLTASSLRALVAAIDQRDLCELY
jgi:hypothetical protein